MKKTGIWVIVSVLVMGGVLISAFECKAQTTTRAQKTLNIGVVAWFGWPMGLDMVHGVQVLADMDNKDGGLTIGKDQYKVNLIMYDSQMDQSKAVAAVNKLVFEDKVKFIVSGEVVPDPLIPITEANKVILCSMSNTPTICGPNIHYGFNVGLTEAMCAITGWLAKNHPDQIKNLVTTASDNLMGHSRADYITRTIKAFGGKITPIFFPPGSTDLSAIGTKVKALQPSLMEPIGGPIDDGLAMTAAWKAGYRGPFLIEGTAPALTLLSVAPPEVLEGLICGAWPVEFDPALTQTAKDFKAAWIAKYGKWEGAEIMGTSNYVCLRAALKQAGSLDTDKVAAAISNGLKFEGPTGLMQMASRPDLGNNRTVEGIVGFIIKRIGGGKPVPIASLTLEEAAGYFYQVFAKK